MQIAQSVEKEMRRFNIYHRKDGRWEGCIPSYQTTGQGSRYTAFYGRTREEVAAKMSQFRTKIAAADLELTVAELYTEWLRCNQPRLKESTVANYMMKADKHILLAFRACQITGLTLDDVYDFIRRKQKAGLSNRYISDILVLMKTVFHYGVMRYRMYIGDSKRTSEINAIASENITFQCVKYSGTLVGARPNSILKQNGC